MTNTSQETRAPTAPDLTYPPGSGHKRSASRMEDEIPVPNTRHIDNTTMEEVMDQENPPSICLRNEIEDWGHEMLVRTNSTDYIPPLPAEERVIRSDNLIPHEELNHTPTEITYRTPTHQETDLACANIPLPLEEESHVMICDLTKEVETAITLIKEHVAQSHLPVLETVVENDDRHDLLLNAGLDTGESEDDLDLTGGNLNPPGTCLPIKLPTNILAEHIDGVMHRINMLPHSYDTLGLIPTMFPTRHADCAVAIHRAKMNNRLLTSQQSEFLHKNRALVIYHHTRRNHMGWDLTRTTLPWDISLSEISGGAVTPTDSSDSYDNDKFRRGPSVLTITRTPVSASLVATISAVLIGVSHIYTYLYEKHDTCILNMGIRGMKTYISTSGKRKNLLKELNTVIGQLGPTYIGPIIVEFHSAIQSNNRQVILEEVKEFITTLKLAQQGCRGLMVGLSPPIAWLPHISLADYQGAKALNRYIGETLRCVGYGHHIYTIVPSLVSLPIETPHGRAYVVEHNMKNRPLFYQEGTITLELEKRAFRHLCMEIRHIRELYHLTTPKRRGANISPK
jgi:hypothetical protein